MNKFRIFASLLLAIAVLFAVPAVAGDGKVYLGAQAGAVFFSDADVSLGSETGVVSSKDGYVVGLTLGKSFVSNDFRAELEGTYRKNELDGLSGTKISGDVTAWTGMFNVLYDIRLSESFVPYLGAGVGLSRVEFKLPDGFKSNDTAFAYQGIAGVTVPLTKNLALDANYKYFVVQDPSFTVPGGTLNGEYRTHNIMAGFRYSF